MITLMPIGNFCPLWLILLARNRARSCRRMQRCLRTRPLWNEPCSVQPVFIPLKSGTPVPRYFQNQPINRKYLHCNNHKILPAPFGFQKGWDFIEQKIGQSGRRLINGCPGRLRSIVIQTTCDTGIGPLLIGIWIICM